MLSPCTDDYSWSHPLNCISACMLLLFEGGYYFFRQTPGRATNREINQVTYIFKLNPSMLFSYSVARYDTKRPKANQRFPVSGASSCGIYIALSSAETLLFYRLHKYKTPNLLEHFYATGCKIATACVKTRPSSLQKPRKCSKYHQTPDPRPLSSLRVESENKTNALAAHTMLHQFTLEVGCDQEYIK